MITSPSSRISIGDAGKISENILALSDMTKTNAGQCHLNVFVRKTMHETAFEFTEFILRAKRRLEDRFELRA